MAARRTAGHFAAVAAVIAGSAVAVACASVLGLDAPDLDVCAHGCSDAAVVDAAPPEAGPSDSGSGASDAVPDRGPSVGVRCGIGPSATACAGSAPVCCQIEDGTGGVTYACRATPSACEGYPIGCASYNDCPGNDVCCRITGSIKCEKQSTCADDALVCDPDGSADQCPSGWSCKVGLNSGDAALPYFGCAK